MSKHTPGPWFPDVAGFTVLDADLDDPNTMEATSVCVTKEFPVEEYGDHEPTDQDVADIYLIAAAPELLEAIEEYLLQCEPDEMGYIDHAILLREQANLKAALAAAKGE